MIFLHKYSTKNIKKRHKIKRFVDFKHKKRALLGSLTADFYKFKTLTKHQNQVFFYANFYIIYIIEKRSEKSERFSAFIFAFKERFIS